MLVSSNSGGGGWSGSCTLSGTDAAAEDSPMVFSVSEAPIEGGGGRGWSGTSPYDLS